MSGHIKSIFWAILQSYFDYIGFIFAITCLKQFKVLLNGHVKTEKPFGNENYYFICMHIEHLH